MLRLIISKAGTGKTATIYREIKAAVDAARPGQILLVPEQYSHEAERELCKVCGPSLSLYAEVFSFTSFARRISGETGGIAVPYLDKGGKMLCMALATKNAESRLTLFRNAAHRPELQHTLLMMNDRLKLSCISSESLFRSSGQCEGELRKKLEDLAILEESYDAVLGQAKADPADRLAVLAGNLSESSISEKNSIYVDGFLDFTRAELLVLEALLKKGAELTICLTMDSISGNQEIFALSRNSARALIAMAKEQGISVKIESPEEQERSEQAPLRLFADKVFSYSEDSFDAKGTIELYRADDRMAECELAAAKALELVRETGCRWRDIAIAVRGFEDYAGTMETVFEDYGVPLFTARRMPIASRPLPSLISNAYAILTGGWRVDDVLSYIDTGLTGLTREESDELAEYIFRWNLTDSSWHSSKAWRQHPDGFTKEYDDEANTRLETINLLRRRLAAPLLALEESTKRAKNAGQQALALSQFLETLHIAERLEKKSEEYSAIGNAATAEEYRQLWDVVVTALEQVYSVMGNMPMERNEFSRLFFSTLTQYDVGLIPASLDAVTAGDFDRMRRRNIRYLMILGASDESLPAAGEETGIFSDDELRTLFALGTPIGEDPDAEMWREYALIYQCLSLPSDKLMLFCPRQDTDGAPVRPSLVMKQAASLFSLQEIDYSLREARCAAERPAFRLALSRAGAEGAAAQKYFYEKETERFDALKRAANGKRGKLSRESVEALYGKELRISASRADRFYSCRFSYFYQYGLKLRARRKLEFDAAEFGTFTHYVLEHTAEEIREAGGFTAVEEEYVSETAKKYIQKYEQEKLNGLEEKSRRFIYLFRRSEQDIVNVALDMARELRNSDFVPLAFELNFGNRELFPPMQINAERDSLQITGIADRIDGWEHEGKLYIRVNDYKTGKKKFSLSDIWYGLSMQMLLYLFALRDHHGAAESALKAKPGMRLVPAGVEYIPARDPYLSLDMPADKESIEASRKKELQRTGLVLNDPEILNAWDHGEEKGYTPVHYDRSGAPKEEDIATEEQFELLYEHIKRRLGEMAQAVHEGAIEADPYEVKAGETPCTYCDYALRCGFTDGEAGERYRAAPQRKSTDVWEMIRKEDEFSGRNN